MNDAAIVDKAEAALREAAREHTKLSFAHRKAAQRLHRLADDMRQALNPLGIAVETCTERSRSIGTDERKSEP